MREKIEVVNRFFSLAFAEMGWTGEVALVETEDNFQTYAVSIRVKFRFLTAESADVLKERKRAAAAQPHVSLGGGGDLICLGGC